MSNIKIQAFTAKSAKTYIPSVAALRVEIFKEYPFLRNVSIEEEAERLKRLTQYKETIVVVVFDGTKIVGASLGCSLKESIPEIQKPFLEHHLEINNYFYFGDSVILKSYRGRGLSHHFFELREKHVKSLKEFKQICFSSIKRAKNDPKKPKDYVDLETFWKKRGYIENTDIFYEKSWKDIGSTIETKKLFTFWFSRPIS